MLSPGADLEKPIRIARAEVLYAAGANADKVSVWFMDNAGKWVQCTDMKRQQNGKVSYVNNTCVVVCAV